MIEKKFWKPSVTSQFPVCPIPFHMDTYRGCAYNCLYCFARDFVTFSRRNSEHKEFSYLVGNKADSLDKWIQRTLAKPYDYNNAAEVAFKERIPIKIGATSDPFPPNEAKDKITFDVLKVFEKYDYPLEIQTKNPVVLASYSDAFENPNWVISVTLISTNDEFLKVVEPNAPSAKSRLAAIKALTSSGKKVMIKIQPAMYPQVLTDLPDVVKAAKEAGCFGFNIEGLKIRKTMPKSEQLLFKKISKVLGYDLREFYIKQGVGTGSDWEMPDKTKMEYIDFANILASTNDLKFYVADNNMGKIGCNGECCGTEVLHDYKIWGNNTRTKAFGDCSKYSKVFGQCKANFMRSQANNDKTLDEVMKERSQKPKKIMTKKLI